MPSFLSLSHVGLRPPKHVKTVVPINIIWRCGANLNNLEEKNVYTVGIYIGPQESIKRATKFVKVVPYYHTLKNKMIKKMPKMSLKNS